MYMQVIEDLRKRDQLNFVKSNGDTTVEKQGQLNDREVRQIREFIKENYKEMYFKWRELANTGYYGE